ncbi:MAG: transposase, partial [Bacteroides thetaiotaomicron]|nr:transposase [Bacteroides thetaiotaomicron]
ASLYKAFPPEEARRIARKLDVHYTPKHGSWLDIAEIGINIMTRECLNRRIPSIADLRNELTTWNETTTGNHHRSTGSLQQQIHELNSDACILI